MQIIKRDGSSEEFDIDKLNKWSSWSSETCNVAWSDIVLKASLHFYDGMEASEVHQTLINTCLSKQDTGHLKMAARLLVGQIYKEAYEDFSIPSLKEFYHEAVENGWWKDMSYTDEELDELDRELDHTKDFTYTYTTLKQFYDKYAVVLDRIVESPQMAMMGMAMDIMGDETNRLEDVKKEYQFLSDLDINLPTPSLNGLRTPLEGSPSCVLISGKDTIDSIGAANHIAYTMTAARSGIGIEIDSRAPKEPVKGGRVAHGGKHSIYSLVDKSVKAMSQVTRGGSATVTYTCLDPEIEKLLTLKLQRTEESYRLDHLDYSFSVNNLFLRKAARNEDWMCISSFFAPKLHELYYTGNEAEFEKEYNRVLNDQSVSKTLVNAQKVLLGWVTARSDTGRNYLTFIDNINQHTPFKDPIRLSNLCQEVLLPTRGYDDVSDLYKNEDNGETSLCFLASIVVKDRTDAEWEELAYYTAKTIDNTIERSVYPFPQIEYTNKKRRNIGVGLTNVAHWMATNNYTYDSEEGRNAIHRLSEKHSYFLHKAAIKLAKERGKCEWFHKTKYADGWLPIDSYKKEVDNYHSQDLMCDWDEIREGIKKYGLRFSVLESMMPVESSSLFTSSTNGLYPVRRKTIVKQSRKGSVVFEVPDKELLEDKYQLAWDIDQLDMVKVYAIVQKFSGQGISADFYHDYTQKPKIVAKEMLQRVFLAAKLGMKTFYYEVFKTTAEDTTKTSIVEEEEGCDSCTL